MSRNLPPREWQHKFYTSKKWRSVRKQAITKNKKNYNSCIPKCELCKTRIRATKGSRGYVYGDHIIEITNDNYNDESITLNIDNIQILCMDCHNKKTFSQQFDFELTNRKNINLF